MGGDLPVVLNRGPGAAHDQDLGRGRGRGDLVEDVGQCGGEGCVVVGVGAVAAHVVVDALDQEQLGERLGGQRLVGLAGELVDAGAGDGEVGVVPAHGRVQGQQPQVDAVHVGVVAGGPGVLPGVGLRRLGVGVVPGRPRMTQDNDGVGVPVRSLRRLR